jgi:hypothetical protein
MVDNVNYNDTVIEIGPGTGSNLKYLIPHFKTNNVNYRAVDIDTDYSDLLKGELVSLNKTNVYLGPIVGDFLNTGSTDKRFIQNDNETVHILLLECTMLMDEKRTSEKISSIIRQNNNTKIYFAHTEFDDEYSATVKSLLHFVKYNIKYLIGIDLGRPTYYNEFIDFINNTNLEIEKVISVRGTIVNWMGTLKIYVTKPRLN